jgi:phosphatidate phosphatase APP1
MVASQQQDAVATVAEPILHWAARFEDRVHRRRVKSGRRRGLVTAVVPFAGYGAEGWARVLCRVLLAKNTGSARSRSENIRGWRSFLSIPVDDADVTVTIDGVEHLVTAGRGGVVDARLRVDLEPGWHTMTLSADGSEPVTAPLFIVDSSQRFGVVSDVDDTVMVTALPRPFLAAWNTFILNEHARRPVPGMSVFYERLARTHPGAPVIYLSTGAWNVAPTLTRFLSRHMYPKGVLLLTDWGPTRDRLFRSGKLHKQLALERLASEFPDMKWLLIGDDGQHDEAIYGEFAAAHSRNVESVAIRQLSVSEAVLAGGRSKAAEHGESSGVRWVYAPDGAGLAQQLADLTEPMPEAPNDV